ncbi:MAG: DUF554 domain-containing protein [Armatimonadetes bacterium]|nr:DUF554 domain-containing protein [Armatimonadota bacterium]
MKGTLYNTATVLVGSVIGWRLGNSVPVQYQQMALHGLGLLTAGMAIRMFLPAKQIVLMAAAIALGGVIGELLGIQHAIGTFSEWARIHLGGESGKFNEGLITTSVLFCVGPMTLIGCLEDGIEGKSELLMLKGTMDGVGAFFFAAALGAGVVVTSAVVLVVQGSLTLLARPMRRFAEDRELLDESAAIGGLILMGTALGLLEIKSLPTANYLPGLFILPLMILAKRKFERPRVDVQAP